MTSFLIGIDPASEHFVASALATISRSAFSAQRFENTPDGFERFRAFLAEHSITPENALLCIENTGVYSEKLCYELHEQGFALVLVDPHKVWKAFSEAPKTDELDSRKIAEYGLRYRDQLRLWQPNEVIVEQVKTLLSTREQLVEQKTATRNARTALSRKAIQTPAANEALDETVDHLKRQIRAIEDELRRLIKSHPTMAQMVAIAMSAPGVGLLLGAHLLVMTRGFTEEPEYRSLAQYLGIAPNAYESGKTIYRKPRSRRYGPSMVRKLLHLSARSLRTHHRRYERYFQRKLQEGKPKRLVLNNIANKQLKVLCAMIKNKEPYIENYRSVNPMLLTS